QVLQAAAIDVLGGDDGRRDRHLLHVLAAAFGGDPDLVEHLDLVIGRGRGVLGVRGRGGGGEGEGDGRGQSAMAEQSVDHLAFLPGEQVSWIAVVGRPAWKLVIYNNHCDLNPCKVAVQQKPRNGSLRSSALPAEAGACAGNGGSELLDAAPRALQLVV